MEPTASKHFSASESEIYSSPGGVLEQLSEEEWELGMQLKFMGYVRCLRYVLPIMVKQSGGRVVNVIGNDGAKPSYWEICPGAANAAGQNLEEVANLVVMLASPLMTMVNSTMIEIDGGQDKPLMDRFRDRPTA